MFFLHLVLLNAVISHYVILCTLLAIKNGYVILHWHSPAQFTAWNIRSICVAPLKSIFRHVIPQIKNPHYSTCSVDVRIDVI